MREIDAPTICVSCGCPIEQPKNGGIREFCSDECRKVGRSFCKACGQLLIQSIRIQGNRKSFCGDLCRNRYYRVGEVSPYIIEEWNRSTCLACGKPIIQPITGRKRKFCSNNCKMIFSRTGYSEKSLYEDWGAYGPETRKALREIQKFIGIGAAKRYATAIDREYVRRGRGKE